MVSPRRSITPSLSVAAPISVRPVQMIAQGIEPPGPELAIGREPCVELGKRLGVEAVEPPRSVDADRHQPRLAERLQVLAYIGLGQVECLDQRPSRLFALPKQSEDVATNGIGKCREDLHAQDMPSIAYSCQGI